MSVPAGLAPTLETLGRCPACSAASAPTGEEMPDPVAGMVLRLARCGACGLVFLDPRLDEAASAALEDRSPFYAVPDNEAERNILALQGMLRNLDARAAGRLLDVGANRGWLLEAGRRNGWTPTGIEPSETAAREARAKWGVRVVPSLDALPPGDRFDLVTAWHVLEHTSQPVAFLRALGSRLAKGGRLALQVPDYSQRDAFVREGRGGALFCAVHTLYFTPETLASTVRAAGLGIQWTYRNTEDHSLTVIASRDKPDRGAAGVLAGRAAMFWRMLRNRRR